MIVGTGIDIVDMRRIQKLWEKHGQSFLDRIFTSYEQNYCLAKNQSKIRKNDLTTLAGNSLAKMFAAKEATLKAIGNTTGISWHEMEIKHESTGRPCLYITGQAHHNLMEIISSISPSMSDQNTTYVKTHLSISDDIPYAIAQVMIECSAIHYQ